ncbi:MAG: NADPH:quinone oxidoreductase family protein [Actinomycetota bacterium]|jgi:NADPH2:quinone reductase|nr:NADPH:quinone oxidoreductase family protein [Actinomycetota bacterium]
MQAVQVHELGGPSALRLVELPEPEPGPDQVVIEVHAAGVTFPDLLLSRGEYQIKPELPFVPGSEVAGVVRSAPPGAAVRPGDRVAAFCGLGGFAEVAAAPLEAVFPLPAQVSLATGAALPMNTFTVHFALTRRGRLRAGETVLVHGAAGGVGTAAVQLASALGATVIAVASSDEKRQAAKEVGAQHVIAPDNFLAETRELTGGRGVAMVVDPVGGDRFTDSLRALSVEGRLLVLGFTGGEIPTVKMNRLLLNNIDVVGVGWGAFWTRQPGYLQQQWAELAPLVADGRIAPPLGRRFPLHETREALMQLEHRQAIGQVLVEPR